MKKYLLLLLFSFLLSITFNAIAVETDIDEILIDFDELEDGIIIDDDYTNLGATFINAMTNDTMSTFPGASPNITIYHTGFNGDGDNMPQPDDPIIVIFNPPVSFVSLTGIDVGINGFMLTAYDATIGGNILAEKSALGSNWGADQHFTLAIGKAGIQRVEFSQTKRIIGEGINFDNLTFLPESVIPEPEPEPGLSFLPAVYSLLLL